MEENSSIPAKISPSRNRMEGGKTLNAKTKKSAFTVKLRTNSKTHEEEEQKNLYILFDSQEEILQHPGVFVVICVLAHSPLMEPHGSRQLICFLASLPYRSVVVVVDVLNRHNVMAMKGVLEKRRPSCEEAHRIALDRGDMYVEAISNALKDNKNVVDIEKIALIRWEDIMDESKGKQEVIIHKHYMNNTFFRERVDEVTMEFLNQRTSNSRYISQRMIHAVKFVLGELAMFVTGIINGMHCTMTAPMATS